MAGTSRNERFLDSTRGRVVRLLRRGPRTVEELAAELELSDNAIRTHLATLERDGLAQQEGTRRGSGAGKPAIVYVFHPEAEREFSRAYAPLLLALLDELAERAPQDLNAKAMRAVGQRLAQALDLVPARGEVPGAEAALAVLESLGGEAVLEGSARRPTLRGCGACPIGEAVIEHPGLCRAIEALLSTTSAMKAVSACEHGAKPRCVFELAANA